MATISWKTIQPWIQSNVSTWTLTPYIPTNQSAKGNSDTETDTGWITTTVYPATPLSAVLLYQDTIYNATYDSARKSILRDTTTDLQTSAITHLKGRAWPVRRTAEGLAAVGLEEGRASTWSSLGWNALAALRECQFVVCNTTAKTIQFFPEDIRTWSPALDVLFIEHECRTIWSNPTLSSKQCLQQKVLDAETNGWSISWPLADGSMEELKTAAEALQLNSAGKKKETLRTLIGRGQSVRHICNFTTE